MATKPKLAPAPKAKRGGQPGNSNASSHRFYSDQFTADEIALVAGFASDPDLTDEIWMQRVFNRRLLQHVQGEELTTDTLVKIAEALAAGTGRVARLLRDKRALSGEATDGLADAIAHALDELGTELDLPL